MIVEGIKKKKTLIVTFLAFIVLFSVSIGTAFAKPNPNKQKIQRTPFTIKWVFNFGTADVGEQEITETGSLYIKDAILIGSIEADLSSPISGAVMTILSGTWDPNILMGSFNGKWTITNNNDTFEGNVVGIVNVINISGKFVGHGIVNLQEHKIMGTFGGTVDNYIVTLTLQGELTHK